MELQLNKPICFFDLETTGINVANDRIVEISILKVFPNGNRESHTWRVNPEMPIPEQASAVHGITNEMVSDKPLFNDIIDEFISFISDFPIVGHNVSFDINFILDKKEQELTIQRLLEEFDLTHLSNIRADNLSGGERKRLTIARALVNNPKILLMDEPFGAVDPINIEMIKKIIVALQKKGVSVIITDHSATNVLSIVDRCSLISSGEIIISGKPKEIVNNLEARRIYFGDSFDL